MVTLRYLNIKYSAWCWWFFETTGRVEESTVYIYGSEQTYQSAEIWWYETQDWWSTLTSYYKRHKTKFFLGYEMPEFNYSLMRGWPQIQNITTYIMGWWWNVLQMSASWWNTMKNKLRRNVVKQKSNNCRRRMKWSDDDKEKTGWTGEHLSTDGQEVVLVFPDGTEQRGELVNKCQVHTVVHKINMGSQIWVRTQRSK